MKIDPDVYKAIIGLGIVAISLVIIAAVLKCFGILNDIFNYFDDLFFYFRKVFFSSYQMDHCQDQQTNRPGIKSHSRVRGRNNYVWFLSFCNYELWTLHEDCLYFFFLHSMFDVDSCTYMYIVNNTLHKHYMYIVINTLHTHYIYNSTFRCKDDSHFKIFVAINVKNLKYFVSSTLLIIDKIVFPKRT